jgi:hypothetical protein
MYEIMKRHGSFFVPIKNAPTFSDRTEAENWAGRFLENNPDCVVKGREGIEVRWISRDGDTAPHIRNSLPMA